jgi:IstB-like ATP binding protein
VEEWIAVFDEPMLGQSALDRFWHRAHQFVIDGESYRKRMAPTIGGDIEHWPKDLRQLKQNGCRFAAASIDDALHFYKEHVV